MFFNWCFIFFWKHPLPGIRKTSPPSKKRRLGNFPALPACQNSFVVPSYDQQDENVNEYQLHRYKTVGVRYTSDVPQVVILGSRRMRRSKSHVRGCWSFFLISVSHGFLSKYCNSTPKLNASSNLAEAGEKVLVTSGYLYICIWC